MNLDFFTAKGNWLDGHGFCRVWMAEREQERPMWRRGRFKPQRASARPNQSALLVHLQPQQQTQQPSLEKRAPPLWGESRGVGRRDLRVQLLSRRVQLYSCSSFSTYELSSKSLCRGQVLPGPYKRAVYYNVDNNWSPIRWAKFSSVLWLDVGVGVVNILIF